jgi:hypothetical protein
MITTQNEPETSKTPDQQSERDGWSRRDLLRTVGIGGATVVVAGTNALSYRVYDTRVLDAGGGKAVRLYEDGWSVARIGDRLGVDATTAWTAIKTQGTHVRDPHGRER